ncbi:cilia- and flagella-associated protein 47-like isoform X3 [Scyliorhinus canicula]|uniref:cilia- and flagella-associated protein 47-like isoform X3 n=1 Tax=Scyliorhinus canicula TaxID=7830 RepID=UPI0018F5210E|nr:cilia- and flagella-associated protein 47-like isoform X3 [Scyliorhinus canicula]
MDIAGLRLSHKSVKFIGVEPGEVHQATITLQNISSTPKLVHIRPAKHKIFHVIVKNQTDKIATGVQISAIIEYSTRKREDAKDECIITSDEDFITIPLFAFVSACDLSIDPEVDFGTLVANSSVLSMDVNVPNHGTLPGQFLIVDKGNLPFLIITPRRGIVLPYTQQLVKVELCTVRPMVLDETFLVKLDNAEDATLRIKANIVQPFLELHDFSGQKIECIQFGGAYYGTSKQDQVILYNNSPEAINWLSVMEDNAFGSEVGTELSLSTDAVLANREADDPKPTAYASALIACQPCQGILNPYSETIVTLCFNPKEICPTKFHRNKDQVPKYRDYALYVRFEAVGSCDGFMQKSSAGSHERKDQPHVELALTGTGFPVSLKINPEPEFDFKECLLGERIHVRTTFQNTTPLLPLLFQFYKTAHFQVTPAKGKIAPGQSRDIVICFAAHQLGTFKVNQVVKFFGLVMLPEAPITLKMQSFHQMQIPLVGVCKSTLKNLIPQIIPAITKEPGMLAQETTDQTIKYNDSDPVTLLNSHESMVDRQNTSKSLETNALVSIPDGRSGSIRPWHGNEKSMREKKLDIYVDPDYAYNDDEVAARKAHKQYYEDYIQRLRVRRLQKLDHREFEKFNNAIDIGLRPAEGLHSPFPEVRPYIPKKRPSKPCVSYLSPRMHKLASQTIIPVERPELACSDEGSMGTSDHFPKQARDGLNAVPSSLQEEKDCNLILTSQQLHKISIGPTTIDFGTVCVYSTSKQNLNIVNNLPIHILIEVATNYPELRESSPLSQVIPPMSAAYLPIIFESTSEGVFQKSIAYTINNNHTGHVLILADVVCVALELSSNELVLTPNYGLLAESGFRTTVRLYNRRNYPAKFSWSPILSDEGIAFFIRPDGGIVDAFNDLECEVVWHASYFSPKDGEFDLIVHHGNRIRLKCIAKLGYVNIRFAESRLLFKSAPWNLVTMKTAVLKNYGQYHAYFKVKNVHPVPGMTVTPAFGTVPIGGHVRFKIYFHPTTVFKFDTRIKLDVRNSNLLKLRVGGSVIRPVAEIDVKCFVFHGVYCGSTCMIPFTLMNLTESQIKLEFDLSKYKDFSLTFEASADASQDLLYPQFYSVALRGNESIKCQLLFSPTDVASYNFNIPVIINGGTSPSPSPSSVPPDPYDEMSIDSVDLLCPATPSRRVQATALSPPLEVSTTKVDFSLLPGYNDLGSIVADPFVKKVEIRNISNKEIKWMLDLNSQENSALEDGTFRIFNYNGSLKPEETHGITVGFCPRCPGKYVTEIPMFMNEDRSIPYRVITLTGVIHMPKLFIDPPFVILNPVPLGTEISATVQISCLDYQSDCTLETEIPEVETEDGTWIKPLSCQFPEGSSLPFQSETIKSITCFIIFSSVRTISLSTHVTFIDQDKKRFMLPVSATADSCLLTTYRYIALHSADQHIVLKTVNNSSKYESIGKVVLQPYYTPAVSSHSTSTITKFSPSTSFFEDSVSDTCESGDSKGEKKESEDEADALGRRHNLGELLFSTGNIAEDIFCEKVRTVVQTWFTLFGCSDGMNPVSIPASLRSTKQIGRDTNTIYDMLHHLTGTWLPGFTGKQPLLSDPMERLLQLHWQYSTLLTFLRAQGACLANVNPEFLLEPEEFKQWNQLQNCSQNIESAEIFSLSDDVFESVSKRAWTEVLLQIYKVFVLSQLTVKDINGTFCKAKHLENMPRINAEPRSSNIYSTGELVLLTWLNHNYETMRNVVWECSQKGAVPPTRWIINFDLDLLDGVVLAAVVAAYCPQLIVTHFENMYTSPAAPEQCLHNSLVILNAFNAIGLDFDIQATDISDPNPVTMLMLCVYLYQRLPNYRPKITVEFTGALHAPVVKQIRLQNPFMKRIVYFATIVGKEATDFTLANGNEVIIPERSHVDIIVEFRSRFLNAEEALLVFVSRLRKGIAATTATFLLISQIHSITPTTTFKCESPCYEQKKMQLNITNPLNRKGDFRVILMEAQKNIFETEHFKCIAALLDNLKMQGHKTNIMYSDLQPESSEFEKSAFDKGMDNPQRNQKISFQANWVPEFFCKMESLHLEAQGSSVLEVFYLPFYTRKCYCTMFFINEQIGEFVFCLEGSGCIPLPSTGLHVFSPDAIQNYCAASGSKIATQVVIYYKCNGTSSFDQELKIPLINEAREKALATVGQQQMSQLEYKRRKITGTLESSSVRASVAALTPCCTEKKILRSVRTDCTVPKKMDYSVELSMPGNFESPDEISIPATKIHRVMAKLQQTCGSLNLREKDKEDSATLPLKFLAKGPGRYTCQILLRSPCDIRLYTIICVVNPEDNFETELEIAASTHQAAIKNIPVHNDTQEDWKIKATLEGEDFFGPSMLHVRSCETSMYPLMFKPNFECLTMGKLVLVNETDGTERIINLKGIGKKPVAVDHVMIDCQVRQITKKVLMVPNYTKTKLTCKVVSDLLIVSGEPCIIIKAGQTAPYLLNILPWKRGKFTGVISFLVEDGTQQQQLPECNSSVENLDNEQLVANVTSTACEAIRDANSEKNKFYRVWFYLEIDAVPAPPEQCLCVTCAVQEVIDVIIPITNPLQESLALDVILKGAGITGDTCLVIEPKEVTSYKARYTPSIVGESMGSVIFHSDLIGEFWYELNLIAKKPTPITLPELQCELGKWVWQVIPLANSTIETLKLELVNSNPGVFTVEIDPRKPLIVNPQSTVEVPVHFSPSTLGKTNHCGTIIFKCPQLEEWTFHLSGVGLLPQQMDPVSISALVNSHASVIVPFENPTNECLLVDAVLTDNEQVTHHQSPSDLLQCTNKESVFCIPLKQNQGVLLAPKEKLDIPLIFAPDEMVLYEGLLVVQIKKQNGSNWPYEMGKVTSSELKSFCRSPEGGISGIRWLYPIHGIPETISTKLSPAVIQCQARSRKEETIKVILTGVVPGPSSTAAVQTQNACNQEKDQASSGQTPAGEFLYEIQYETEKARTQMEPTIALNFVAKVWDVETGIVTLTFNIVFAPYKPISQSAMLKIQAATGGIWRFPLLLIATEPQVDDVINIEAFGLNKESVVCFRLTSQTRHPMPFTAHFLPCSDLEFVVSPQTGELLPLGSTGTLFTVGFTPRMYSKKYKAKLLIQTMDMQWMYEINGLDPQYTPPNIQHGKIIHTDLRLSVPVRQRNFIRENLKMITTAVSSPLKGAPLCIRSKTSRAK